MEPKLVRRAPVAEKQIAKESSKKNFFEYSIITAVKTKNVKAVHFLILSLLFVTLFLALHTYWSNFVYVVIFNDRELGVVNSARDVESFVADLTERCGDLYGLEMKPGDDIEIRREFRPESMPDSDVVKASIRQQISFLADAYMLTVDGEPVVALDSPDHLDFIVDQLKSSYSRSSHGVRILETVVLEDLELEACAVSPENVYTADEVLTLLVSSNSEEQSAGYPLFAGVTARGALESRQLYNNEHPAAEVHDLPARDYNNDIINADEPLAASNSVHVITIEEVTVTETIPFETEFINDDSLWVVQSEIITPGEEGSKEIVYHVTRENGLEVERVKIEERIIAEPLTQVEALGTAQVPSVGQGQFIWPVQGGGEVSPGRGFSAFHTGIDICADMGTNVLAADDGVVWFSGRGGSQGNYIIIYHGNFWTLYLHNQENLVSKGQQVSRGQTIARLGSTGRSTGPHLHFEVRLDDGTGEWHGYYQHKPVDPLVYFKP